jgi:hypothetical protein
MPSPKPLPLEMPDQERRDQRANRRRRGSHGGRPADARRRHPPENQWNRAPVCRYRAVAHSHPVKDVPLYTT